MRNPRERQLFIALVLVTVLSVILLGTTIYYRGKSDCPVNPDNTTTTTISPPTSTTPVPSSTVPTTQPTSSTKPTTTTTTASTTTSTCTTHPSTATTPKPPISTAKTSTTTGRTTVTAMPITVPLLHKTSEAPIFEEDDKDISGSVHPDDDDIWS